MFASANALSPAVDIRNFVTRKVNRAADWHVVIMLTKTRLLRRCLFGPPDPQETRRLCKEQFATDRQMMLLKYNYDILTCRFVTNNCFHEDGETVIESEDILVPESTNEVETRRCSPESEVRYHAGRYAPYNRQTRITGKQRLGTVPMFPRLEMVVDVGRRRVTSPDL
jgi:hypothetical protein